MLLNAASQKTNVNILLLVKNNGLIAINFYFLETDFITITPV